MKALIYANGAGKRWADNWPDDQPKQLVEVEGEKILHRTVRQLKERGVENVVVVSKYEALDVDGAERWAPGEDAEFLVDTVKLSAPLWEGRMLCLFGDVFFTDKAMDTIVGCEGMQWFGRDFISHLTHGSAEIFGWTMDPEQFELMEKAVDFAIKDARDTWDEWIESIEKKNVRPFPFEPGAIFQPYLHLLGRGPQTPCLHSPLFKIISDWTDDFDTPNRFTAWMHGYKRRWIGDKGKWHETEQLETFSAK